MNFAKRRTQPTHTDDYYKHEVLKYDLTETSPMSNLDSYIAKSCMLSCLSKFYNKKKFHPAVYEI